MAVATQKVLALGGTVVVSRDRVYDLAHRRCILSKCDRYLFSQPSITANFLWLLKAHPERAHSKVSDNRIFGTTE
ncbi:MAG TPA: hypothetical protein V6D35_08260 [Candidatus Sericytochromatia bacterium]